ncbi:MAG: hypothetical protein OHK0038_27690 [Flammeovirgaceae bacterium]
MIAHVRDLYNESFTEEKYAAFLKEINPYYDLKKDFRISETPVFVSKAFKKEMLNLFEDIKAFLYQKDFVKKMEKGLPEKYKVSRIDSHATLAAIDMAVCQMPDGSLQPRLIELQGVASLYYYQYYLNLAYAKHFSVPKNYTFLFDGVTEKSYFDTMRRILVGNEDPENVIMMDIKPLEQKTRIDFIYTCRDLGIKALCVSEVIQRGNKLFYKNDKGVEVPIKRIYNRMIFDELERRPDIKIGFNHKDDLDVVWNAHPNWYFYISKYCLPFINSQYVPAAKFLSDYQGKFPEDLENYVLKPLYSFAGVGVEVDVTLDKIKAVKDPENWILQKKVKYAPFLKTPDGYATAEIRFLCTWEEELIPQLTLARLSKGKMIGVDFNKNKTWVGSSAVFFEG